MNDHQYTDQEICCIIRDYDQMIQDIRHRIESLARELWDLDSNDDWLCKLLSLQHQETGTITTHTDHHDFTLKLDILSILLKQIFHLNIIQNSSIAESHPNFISSVPKF